MSSSVVKLPVYPDEAKKIKKGSSSAKRLQEESKDMNLMQTMLMKDFEKLIKGDITSKMVI